METVSCWGCRPIWPKTGKWQTPVHGAL